MLDKYDPGLISGAIGAVIGIMLASILKRIKNVHHFSKLRKNLKDEVERLKDICFANDSRIFDKLPELVGEASGMVREDRDVPPWFWVISRYRESNKMAKLLSEIETERSRLCQTYGLEQMLTSHQQQTNQGQTSSPLTQVNQAVAQTDTAEEMTNEEKPMPAVLRRRAVAQTDTAEEMTNEEKPMPAVPSNDMEERSHLLQTQTSQPNQAVAQTDTAEEMTNEEKPMPAGLRQRRGSRAANAQAVAQTDTAEEMTDEENQMPTAMINSILRAVMEEYIKS